MPPLIRKAPLKERIVALLNPYDFLLYLSEELHESAIDEKLRDWTVPIGVAANLLYMLARANSANDSRSRQNDDVFGDYDGRGGSGWFAWFASFTAHLLALLSLLNALYLFTRNRKYRLFESSIDVPPTTPSARRVKVEDSPMSSSPLSYFSQKFASNSAAARAHPDDQNDVWELSIWDPKPLHLSLFALFSPGHVLVYWLFLPTSSLDPRPSVTVLTTIVLAALMSAQLLVFKTFFEQKSKDDRVLNKEVFNEYDTKFVHPSLNRPVRDVGTQSRESAMSSGKKSREVEVYTPTTIINRGFRVNPNPSYAGHLGKNVNTDELYAETPAARRLTRASTSLLSPTPATGAKGGGGYSSSSSTSMGVQASHDREFGTTNSFTSPSKPLSRLQSQPVLSRHSQQQPQDRSSNFRPAGTSDGGSLGVFTHAASPLRKSTGGQGLLRHQRSNGAMDSGRSSMGSPLKRVSQAPLPGPNFGSGTGSGTGAGSSRGGGLDYLGRPILGKKASDRKDRRERNESGSASGGGDDGLRQRFGGLRDAGTGDGSAKEHGTRQSRPY